MTCAENGDDGSRALSEAIRALPFPGGDKKACVSDITRDMDTLAHNLVIFLIAALGIIPAPPGTSALIGVPLMIVAVQKALHLPLKLPGPVMRARLSRSRFEAARTRILSWLSISEGFVTPRPGWHHRRSAKVTLDWSVVGLSIGMLIPLPMTAMLPAFSICVITVGRLEQDPRWICFGLLSGSLSLGVCIGMAVFALRLMGRIAG